MAKMHLKGLVLFSPFLFEKIAFSGDFLTLH
jgi:hypothetical protein